MVIFSPCCPNLIPNTFPLCICFISPGVILQLHTKGWSMGSISLSHCSRPAVCDIFTAQEALKHIFLYFKSTNCNPPWLAGNISLLCANLLGLEFHRNFWTNILNSHTYFSLGEFMFINLYTNCETNNEFITWILPKIDNVLEEYNGNFECNGILLCWKESNWSNCA